MCRSRIRRGSYIKVSALALSCACTFQAGVVVADPVLSCLQFGKTQGPTVNVVKPLEPSNSVEAKNPVEEGKIIHDQTTDGATNVYAESSSGSRQGASTESETDMQAGSPAELQPGFREAVEYPSQNAVHQDEREQTVGEASERVEALLSKVAYDIEMAAVGAPSRVAGELLDIVKDYAQRLGKNNPLSSCEITEINLKISRLKMQIQRVLHGKEQGDVEELKLKIVDLEKKKTGADVHKIYELQASFVREFGSSLYSVGDSALRRITLNRGLMNRLKGVPVVSGSDRAEIDFFERLTQEDILVENADVKKLVKCIKDKKDEIKSKGKWVAKAGAAVCYSVGGGLNFLDFVKRLRFEEHSANTYIGKIAPWLAVLLPEGYAKRVATGLVNNASLIGGCALAASFLGVPLAVGLGVMGYFSEPLGEWFDGMGDKLCGSSPGAGTNEG